MAEYVCIADGDAVWADAGPGREELQGLVAPAAGDVPPTISFMSIGCGRLYVLFQRDRERRGIMYCLSAQYPLRRAEATSLLSLVSALYWGWTPPAEGGTGSALLTPAELRSSLQRALEDTLQPFEPQGGPLPPPVPPSVYPRVHFPKGVKQQVHDVLGEGEEEGGGGRGGGEEEEEDEEKELAWEREEKRKRREKLMRLMAKSSSEKPPPFPSPTPSAAPIPDTTSAEVPPGAIAMNGTSSIGQHPSSEAGSPPATHISSRDVPTPTPDASAGPSEDEPLLVDILAPEEGGDTGGTPLVAQKVGVGGGGAGGDDEPLLVGLVTPLEEGDAGGVPGGQERLRTGEGRRGGEEEEEQQGKGEATPGAEARAVGEAVGARGGAALPLGPAGLLQASAPGVGEDSFSQVPRGVPCEADDASSASSVAGSLSSGAGAEEAEQEEESNRVRKAGEGAAKGPLVVPEAAAQEGASGVPKEAQGDTGLKPAGIHPGSGETQAVNGTTDWSAIKSAALAGAGAGLNGDSTDVGAAPVGTEQQQASGPITMGLMTAVSPAAASRKEQDDALASASSYPLTPREKPKGHNPKESKGAKEISQHKDLPPRAPSAAPSAAVEAAAGEGDEHRRGAASRQPDTVRPSGDTVIGESGSSNSTAGPGAEARPEGPLSEGEPLGSTRVHRGSTPAQGLAVPSPPKVENINKGVGGNKGRRPFHLFSPRHAQPGAKHEQPGTPTAAAGGIGKSTLSPATSLGSRGADDLKTEALALLASSEAPDGAPATPEETPPRAGGVPPAAHKKFPDLMGMEADVAPPRKGHVAVTQGQGSPAGAEHTGGASVGDRHGGGHGGGHSGGHSGSHLGMGGLGRMFQGRRGIAGEPAREQGQGSGKERREEVEAEGAAGAETTPGTRAESTGPSAAGTAEAGEVGASGDAHGVPEASGSLEEEHLLAERETEKQRRSSFSFLRGAARAHPKASKGAPGAAAGVGAGAEGGAGAEEPAAKEGTEGGEEKGVATGAGEHEGGSSGAFWGGARGRRRGSLTILRSAGPSNESHDVLAQGQKQRRSFVVSRPEILGSLVAGGAGGEEGVEEGDEDEDEDEEDEEEEARGSLGTPLGSSTPDSLAGSNSSKGASKGEHGGKGLGGLFRKGGSALRMFDRKAAAR